MGLVKHVGKMGKRTQIQRKNFSVKDFMRDLAINGITALKQMLQQQNTSPQLLFTHG
jgi:hypothetical protein